MATEACMWKWRPTVSSLGICHAFNKCRQILDSVGAAIIFNTNRRLERSTMEVSVTVMLVHIDN